MIVSTLRCHEATPCEEVGTFNVMMRRTTDELELRYIIDGNIARIRLTPVVGSGAQFELWRHTCFEVFIAIEGECAYYEFNFAPSRQWRAYTFRAYRDPDPQWLGSELSSPTIAVSANDRRLELHTRIVLPELSAIHSRSALRLGLSAIIESLDGTISYWALRHPAGKPDFHHTDAFAQRLAAPEC
jgi:hypothetical protein